MEKKIYDRQISKQGMSGIPRREEWSRGVRERGREGDVESGVEKGMRERGLNCIVHFSSSSTDRVVDELHPERHFTLNDIITLVAPLVSCVATVMGA